MQTPGGFGSDVRRPPSGLLICLSGLQSAFPAASSSARMKASLAAVLAALLCVERVSSMMCFSCDNVESNWECMSMKTCDTNNKYCITKYFGGGVGEKHKQSISKGCSATCPQGGIDLGLMAFSVKCCETSLCNMSGAITVKSSALLLAVGTLASLFYIFGAKL